MARTLKKTFQYCIYTGAIVLFLTAVAIQGIRLGMAYANEYRNNIETFLSERLSADVTLEAIEAKWVGLRPSIQVKGLTVVSRIDQSLLSASSAFLRFDLSETFLNRSPVFKNIRFEDLSMTWVQDEKGRWLAAGFSPSSSSSRSSWRYRTPTDLFSTVQFAHLDNTQLRFLFHSGKEVSAVFPEANIRNEDDNHYLSISGAIDRDKDAFSIVVEAQPSAENSERLDTKAYVNLTQFPLERLSRLFIGNEALDESILDFEQASVNAELWFDFNGAQQFRMIGDVAYSGSLFSNDSQSDILIGSQLTDAYRVPLTASVSASYNFNEAFVLDAYEIVLDQNRVDPIKLFMDEKFIKLSTNQIDLGDWSSWVLARFLPSTVKTLLTEMAPTGTLDNITLSSSRNDFSDTTVKANVSAVSINKWQNIPAFKNISGYLESNIERGALLLDSENFELDSDGLFDNAFVMEQAKGQVAWYVSPETNRIEVTGQQLAAVGEYGIANGYFELTMPWQANTKSSNLILQLGLRQTSAQYYPLFIPKVLPDELTTWMSSAIKQGEISEAGFLYRGGFQKDSPRSVQLFLDVDDGELRYQNDWPAIKALSGRVMLDNEMLYADIDRASIYGNDTLRGKVAWNEEGNNHVEVQARIETSAKSALKFVNDSPLRTNTGSALDAWVVEGDVDIDIDLSFPLDENPQTIASQLVELKLNNNRLFLSEQNLDFNNVNGGVFYSSQNGFSSLDLYGDLFDEQTLVDIDTQEDGQLSISGVSKIDMAVVSDWLEQPLLSVFAQGDATYSFDFLLGEDDFQEPVQQLSIFSDLQGVAIDVPAPFGKTSLGSREFVLNAVFIEAESNFTIQLGNQLMSQLSIKNDESFYSIINLSDQPIVEPAKMVVRQEGLAIEGNFESINVESWLPFFEKLNNSTQDEGEDLPIFYNIKAQSVDVLETIIQNVSVLGQDQENGWENTIASDMFAGNVFYRAGDAVPLSVNLDYLLWQPFDKDNISSKQGIEEEAMDPVVNIDPWSQIDFSVVPSMQVDIAYLEYDQKPLGQWSFDLDAQPNIIELKNVKAELAELTLQGRAENSGATLRWEKSLDDNIDQTTFLGSLKGGDLKSLFDQWDAFAPLENKALAGEVNLSWQGSPAAFQVAALDGIVDFSLEEGVFKESEGNTTGVLRVLSFLNFDTWVRRIQFDFSNAFSDGLAFDELDGELSFDEGIIRLSKPIKVSGDTISLSLAGVVDYPNNTVDGELGVVLPVGGNLTFAAALSAGLPAAVGLYLVRKIFKEEFDKASTVTYTIAGDLNDPKLQFKQSPVPDDDVTN